MTNFKDKTFKYLESLIIGSITIDHLKTAEKMINMAKTNRKIDAESHGNLTYLIHLKTNKII